MAFDSLSGSLAFIQAWTPVLNGPTTNHGGRTTNTTLTKRMSFTLGAAVANGVNEIYSTLLTISASGSTTLDLSALTDVLGASLNFARLKGYSIWLLSTTDDSTYGSACSSITVGNAASNQQLLNLGAAAHTFDVQNGAIQSYFTPNASGMTVDGTHKSLKILNNDSGVSAKVCISLFGSDS